MSKTWSIIVTIYIWSVKWSDIIRKQVKLFRTSADNSSLILWLDQQKENIENCFFGNITCNYSWFEPSETVDEMKIWNKIVDIWLLLRKYKRGYLRMFADD